MNWIEEIVVSGIFTGLGIVVGWTLAERVGKR